MTLRTTVMTGLVMVLLTTGCGGGPASGSGATVVEDAEAATDDASPDEADDGAEQAREPDDTHEGDGTEGDGDDETDAAEDAPDDGEDVGDDGEAEEEPLGTRDHPLSLGTTIEMGDWALSVEDVTLDAHEVVADENEFNDPPAEGRQFVLFRVSATYEGEDSGDPWDVGWGIVGSEGNTFGPGGSMDDHCGVIPDPLDEKGETFPGGSIEGNVCVSIDADQLDGATIRVEEMISFDDTRAFYAVQ